MPFLLPKQQRQSTEGKVQQQQCRINANRGPWQLFARAPLLTRDKDLSQPATRVIRHACSYFVQSSRYQYGPFLFFAAEVMSNYLTTDGLKNFSLLPEAPLRPEARGICMVNPALNNSNNVLYRVCTILALCNGLASVRRSVHPSLCPIGRQKQRRPAGLLLSAQQARDIDR